MRRIFTGMLLVFLNFNIHIGGSTIGLIPSFIGYVIMRRGIAELEEYSDRFARVRPSVTAMVFFSGAVYFCDMFGINAGPAVGIISGLVLTVVSLYISYCIVMGVGDIETATGRNIGGAHLYSVWKNFAIFEFATYALMFFGQLLAVICIILTFFIAVWFLHAFSKSRDMFYE